MFSIFPQQSPLNQETFFSLFFFFKVLSLFVTQQLFLAFYHTRPRAFFGVISLLLVLHVCMCIVCVPVCLCGSTYMCECMNICTCVCESLRILGIALSCSPPRTLSQGLLADPRAFLDKKSSPWCLPCGPTWLLHGCWECSLVFLLLLCPLSWGGGCHPLASVVLAPDHPPALHLPKFCC